MDSNNTNHLFDEKTALWLFTEKKPSLQELSSFQVAWTLWSDIMLSGKYHDYKSELRKAIIDTMQVALKIIECLRLPSSVEEHVEKYVKKHVKQAFFSVQQSLTMWIAYHEEPMLCGLVPPGAPVRKITLYTCHLKYAMFKPDGDMDIEGSARKMLKAKQFNKKISFEIMCRFCMEDELMKLPIDEVRKLSGKFTWEKNPLAWYWICHLIGKLDTGIPKFTFENGIVHEECCPYSLILTTLDIDNWSNIMYFWNRLCNEEDQAMSASIVLVNINLNWFLKAFYWKLNSEQWRFVFNAIPADILFTFFRQYRENEKGLFLWKRMKDTMKGDVFLSLMERVLSEKTKGGDWSIPTAMELWQTAGDHLKNYVLQHDSNSIIENNFFEPTFIRKSEKNLEFLFDLLSFASVQYRKQMILKHGDVLFLSDDLPAIDKIIKLCLPKARDFAQFQKFITKSKYVKFRVELLLVEGKFAHLNEFFDNYFPNEPATKTYKKQVVESNKKGCNGFIFEPTTWSEFEKFIDSVGYGSSTIASIKKQYVCAFKLNCIEDRGNIEQLNYLRDIVSGVLAEEEVVEFKKCLLIDLANELENLVTFFAKRKPDAGKFVDAGFFDKLVSWCCISEKTLEKSDTSSSKLDDNEGDVGNTVDADFSDQKTKEFKQTLHL